MVVDYEGWEKQEDEESWKLVGRALDELRRGGEVSLTLLAPELELKPDDHYTLWLPPGRPETKQRDPTANLENLIPLYNKIIIPINLAATGQDFEYKYAMPLEALIEQLKDNKDKYLPVAMVPPNEYSRPGFYDKLFEDCRELYGRYPPMMGARLSTVQSMIVSATLASLNGISSMEETLKKYPDFDLNHVRDVEVEPLFEGDRGQLYDLARERRTTEKAIKRSTATMVWSLRIYGHDRLANYILDLNKKRRDLRLLHRLAWDYYKFLVSPVDGYVGGFANYTTRHLEEMAFLRVLPLIERDVEVLREENRRLLLNSPAARSLVSLPSRKMNVFLGGKTDVKTLNKLSEMAESHKKEMKTLAEYRACVARGNLLGALRAFDRAGAVIEQIGDEVKAWKRREKVAEWSVSAGTTIIGGIPTILSNLPAKWRLVIHLFTDPLRKFLEKRLDPKSVVESFYDVKNWPWYEKGFPYLYWREPSKS